MACHLTTKLVTFIDHMELKPIRESPPSFVKIYIFSLYDFFFHYKYIYKHPYYYICLTKILFQSSTRDTQLLLLPVLRLPSHCRITSYSSFIFYFGLSLLFHTSKSQYTQVFRKVISNSNAATQATITQHFKTFELIKLRWVLNLNYELNHALLI